jgi:uncharacterized protein involved in outer membrane biogenesis
VAAVLVLAVVLFLALFDWNMLRGPIGRYASHRTGRLVRLEGDLRVHLLSWTPSVSIGGLKIGNPQWAGPGDTADVDRLTVQIKLLPLLGGHVDLPLVDVRRPNFQLIRDAQSRENWQLGGPSSGKPFRLPPIQRFIIYDGRIRLTDARHKLVLTGTVQAKEDAARPSDRGFELLGQGTLNREPFRVQAAGGPLLHVQRDKPYPFLMTVDAGATHVRVDGDLDEPFNLGLIHGNIALNGPNLADLYDLTGVVFPSTPTYRLAAAFDRKDSRYDFRGIGGKIGSSDLHGSLTLDKPADRRTVTADLSSRQLVFADLMAVIGGGSKRVAAPTVHLTTAAPPPPKAADRLLPDAPLYKDRLDAMDATVRYRAEAVRTSGWPLKRASLVLKLDHSVLTLDPVSFQFPQGQLIGKVRIDGRKPVPVTDLDVRVSNVSLQQFLKNPGAKPAIEGLLQARAQLHGAGDSIHKAAAAASGRVVFVTPHGEIRQAFAELMGINVANGLYLLLSKDPKETPLRCGVADFTVRNGVMQASDSVLDTEVVRATLKGTVNLGSEQLDLRLEGQPKKPRLLHVWAPITLRGSLAHPAVGVDAAKVAAQAGVGLALGALIGPLAAIFPFLEPGLAKDADCAALMAEARSQGAPVKTPAPSGPMTAPQQH